ncbi:MAG: HDOD domain-containing protein [Pirellulaceae bacterium]|nr:HDOD domain-containing protein [Pirellulaceae bacterium]
MIESEPTSQGLVQQFVERAGQLYSLPAAAAEVLRLTESSSVDNRALKECLECDPALAMRVLKVVNSSLFGLSRPVADLSQAVALLGAAPLRMLVLGFSLPKELFRGLSANVLARYWRHTLIKAVAAREIAEQLLETPGDEAFVAGLLQDIGLLALVQQLGEPYLQLVDSVYVDGGSLLDRELEILGFDHALLSSRLLTRWGLPEEIAQAVAVPLRVEQIERLEGHCRRLPQLLHLAELLAQLIERPYGSALHELLEAGAAYFQLTIEKLRPVVSELELKVADLADVLALELPTGETYLDLLAAAQSRLSELTLPMVAAQTHQQPEGALLDLTDELRCEMRAILGRPAPKRPAESITGSRVRIPSPDSAALASRPRRIARASDQSSLACEVGFMTQVSAAIGRCRAARMPVSLLLVAVDHHSELLLQLGPGGVADLLHWLQRDLAEWLGERASAQPIGQATFGVILEQCSRNDAVSAARHALAAMKSWSLPGGLDLDIAPSLSAGIASLTLPPKNFLAESLLDGAQRCLAGAQLSGGGSVKSIEL